MAPLLIGCDNAAVDLKKSIVAYLTEKGLPFEDVGVLETDDDTMYPMIAQKVAQKIQESNYEREGVLLCGTGIGMAIAANKFKGIYAAVCHDPFSAERARKSNNTNIITMGARVIGQELAKKILEEWLNSKYVVSSSTPKVNTIAAFESENFK